MSISRLLTENERALVRGPKKKKREGGILFVSLGSGVEWELVLFHNKDDQRQQLVHPLAVGNVSILLGPDKQNVGHHLLCHLVTKEVLLGEAVTGDRKK